MCQAQAQSGQIVRQVLSRPERTKLNTDDDRRFYDSPRLVKHVDDGFLAQVTQLYRCDKRHVQCTSLPSVQHVQSNIAGSVCMLPSSRQFVAICTCNDPLTNATTAHAETGILLSLILCIGRGTGGGLHAAGIAYLMMQLCWTS